MKSILFAAEVEADVEASMAFYEAREAGLGEAFYRELKQGTKHIQSNPELFPCIPEEAAVRQYCLRRFPFRILYKNYPESILIVAIAHTSRRPGFWTGRG